MDRFTGRAQLLRTEVFNSCAVISQYITAHPRSRQHPLGHWPTTHLYMTFVAPSWASTPTRPAKLKVDILHAWALHSWMYQMLSSSRKHGGPFSLICLVMQVIAAEDTSNEVIDLGGKSHFTFGRLEDICDFCLVGGWHVSVGALLILHGDLSSHLDFVM